MSIALKTSRASSAHRLHDHPASMVLLRWLNVKRPSRQRLPDSSSGCRSPSRHHHIAPADAKITPVLYRQDWRSRDLTPRTIDAALVPGPVISGNVVATKLRRITPHEISDPFPLAIACTSSPLLRRSMRQPVAAPSGQLPKRATGNDIPKRAGTQVPIRKRNPLSRFRGGSYGCNNLGWRE